MQEACSAPGVCKMKYACIVEAGESTRSVWKELKFSTKGHADHIAIERNMVHKFTPECPSRSGASQEGATEEVPRRSARDGFFQVARIPAAIANLAVDDIEEMASLEAALVRPNVKPLSS